MARIVLTASARRDLDEIWDYVAVENQSPVAADNLIDEIGRRLKLVADQPMSGELVDRLRKQGTHNGIRLLYRILAFLRQTLCFQAVVAAWCACNKTSESPPRPYLQVS